ncbi:MAG: 1-acyl-sn-glycerol-3-phosphate acyltransferase [Sphingobacterium sp.]
MVYTLLRSLIKLGLHWYLPDRQLKNLRQATDRQPALIVSNHPNSFFDALVLVAYQPVEICFLTRGDLFKHPFINWLLRTLNMLPIYKRSDDPDAETKNAFTYDECANQLEQGRKILIFPEGVSRNHIQLRPFMPAGTSAVISRAVRMDIPIQIQPYVLGYSSFDYVPKSLYLEALPTIDSTDFLEDGEVKTDAVLRKMRRDMEEHMWDHPIPPRTDEISSKQWMRVPGRLGKLTHAWFYHLIRKKIEEKTKGTIFFDSLLFTALIFIYPASVFLISLLVGLLLGFWWALALFLTFPFLAYCWVNTQPIKTQLEDTSNRVNHLRTNDPSARE